MTSWPRFLVVPFALGAVILDPFSGEALAQLSPSQLPQPGAPAQADKPAGVAEQAEEGPDQLPTTPVLPPVTNERKRFELVEVNGYYRFRIDWFKNFHMGFRTHQTNYAPTEPDAPPDPSAGGSPFPQPLGCRRNEEGVVGQPCGDTLKGANMRLRLEPTINVTETARIHMQVDMLDNVVLGSTPQSFDPTHGGFQGNVMPPGPAYDLGDSIIVRRAWAEVDTALGTVTVGRQPWHWGMGIFANGGGADPFSGTYNYDAEFGDTVDRLMFRTEIPGTRILASIATDWPVTYPSSAQDPRFAGRGGQPWDLEDSDDASRWVVALTRFDRPELFVETMARGEWAFNYGGFVAYTTQDWATTPVPVEVPDGEEAPPTLEDRLVRRGLKTYAPNVWARVGRGDLMLEAEAMAVIGEIANVGDVNLAPGQDMEELVTESVSVRSFAGAARASYRAFEGKLGLGFEVGFASGDQWRNDPPGSLHVSQARPLPIGGGDTTIRNFIFDPDYFVDLILFREIIGAVTNATYFKPSASYALTDEIAFQGRGILSLANNPEATPGNGRFYGLELNGDVSYTSGAFTAGIAYGVLFPFAALDHPVEPGEANPIYGESNAGDAGTAQTIQMRLNVRF